MCLKWKDTHLILGDFFFVFVFLDYYIDLDFGSFIWYHNPKEDAD